MFDVSLDSIIATRFCDPVIFEDDAKAHARALPDIPPPTIIMS